MRIHSIEAIAVDVPLTRNFGGNRPPIEDGLMELATGPGFGFSLDDAMIRRDRVN